MKQARTRKTRVLIFGTGVVILASLGMAIAGELDTMLSWWMAIALLLPPLLWALKTRYAALITICSIGFATQFVTLPFFYFDRDNFAWGHVKPFDFTPMQAFPMLMKVSLYLFALIVFFIWFYRISFIGGAPSKLTIKTQPIPQTNTSNLPNESTRYGSRPSPQSRRYKLFIILIVTGVAPLNWWMFSQGISIVGIEPPDLPYHLPGILYYLTHFITPLVLAYLYWKTDRGWLLTLILLVYAWVLGLSQLSRSSFIFVVMPILLLAWLDRRQLVLWISGFSTLVGFNVVTVARDFAQIVTASKTVMLNGNSLASIVSSVFSDPDSRFQQSRFLLNSIAAIFGRVDGFDNLVMSSNYDPYAVIDSCAPLGFILRTIWRGLVPMDVDLHHIQWQGNVLPESFYNGGALLSNAVIVGNAGLWWVVLSAMVTAVTLVILEKSAKRAFSRYKIPELLSIATISFLSILYFIEAGGSATFVFPFVFLVILSFLPPLFHFKRQLNQKGFELP